jgi:hypothetical protein
MEIILAQFDAAKIASIFAVMMVVALRLGWWLGHSRKIRSSDMTNSQWYGAVLSLLSLLLAFTVNTSIAKQNQRQQLVVADSNAIRDFYTHAGVLNEPAKSKLQELIREYTKLRIDLSQRLDEPSFENGMRRSDQIQAQMNDLVAGAVKNGTPLGAALINAFDGMADRGDARLAANRDRLPTSVVLLLISAALVATLLVGVEEGTSGGRHMLGAAGFIFLVSFTVYVTLDLNQPEQGRITVSQEPIERLFLSMPK